MKLFDYLAPFMVVAVFAGTGKLVFLGLGQHLEAEWAFPMSLLQYVVYGAIPVDLIGVLIVRILAGKWLWHIKPASTVK